LNQSSIFGINRNIKHTSLPIKSFVDTNVILDIYFKRPHRNDWLTFLQNSTSKGTEFLYDLHILHEIRNVLNVHIHSKEAKKLGYTDSDKKPAWKILEDDPSHNLMPQVKNEVVKIQSILKKAGMKFVVSENDLEKFELENLYSEKYGLGPGDSIIAASMDKLKVNSICTDDHGFAKTDHLNIYTPSSELIAKAIGRDNRIKPFKHLREVIESETREEDQNE